MSDPIVIVSVARTPIGSMNGEMSSFAGQQLGAFAIKAALERAGLKPEQIQEVIMGCVLPAGQVGGRHHHQQGLRLGHEGRHAGP
jgi:acetyl-CoA C-acetyltransferase